MKKTWLNIPNLLTGLRILLVPALLISFFRHRGGNQLPSLCLFLGAGLTDCLDGHFARRLNQVTPLGKVLDPVADKLLTAAVMVCLIASEIVSWVALAVVVAKELYMAVGASVCIRRGLGVSSDAYGKVATLLFYPAVLLAWPWHGVEALCLCGRALVYLSVALSVIAAIHYTLDSVKKWRERKAR